MNCQLCQNEFDAYYEGRLPEGTGILVKEHLKSCSVCSESFQLLTLANEVMDAEMKVQSNPFLVTRIMSGIEEMEQKSDTIRLNS
jgi:predicted anti-sigma-YlaC factor YlaD